MNTNLAYKKKEKKSDIAFSKVLHNTSNYKLKMKKQQKQCKHSLDTNTTKIEN